MGLAIEDAAHFRAVLFQAKKEHEVENAAPMTPDPYESGREEDQPAQPDAAREISQDEHEAENAVPMTLDPDESGDEEGKPPRPEERRRSEAEELLDRARRRHQDEVAQVYREIPKQILHGALRSVGSKVMEKFIDLISGSF